jgi:hypothetical protein
MMKRTLLQICLFSLFALAWTGSSVASELAQDNRTGPAVSLGFGFFSDRGLLGIGLDWSLPNQALVQLSTGIDFAGYVHTAMYKHPLLSQQSNEWYTRCFFLFDCRSTIYLGVGLKSFGAYRVRINDGAADMAEYQVGSRTGAGVTLSMRDYYGSSDWFTDVDLSYRAVFAPASITLSQGTDDPQHRDNIRQRDSSIGFALSVGYLF